MAAGSSHTRNVDDRQHRSSDRARILIIFGHSDKSDSHCRGVMTYGCCGANSRAVSNADIVRRSQRNWEAWPVFSRVETCYSLGTRTASPGPIHARDRAMAASGATGMRLARTPSPSSHRNVPPKRTVDPPGWMEVKPCRYRLQHAYLDNSERSPMRRFNPVVLLSKS